MKKQMSRRAGFTLVELLAVLGILVLVGGVAVVAYTRVAESGRVKATQALINELANGVDLYRQQMGEYPSQEDGLQALITAPADDEETARKWTEGGGPFLKKNEIPRDPWGNEITYVRNEDATGGPEYQLYSWGPNKIDDSGGEDDIANVKTDENL